MLKKVFVFLLGTFFALILLECSLRIVGLIYSYNKQARNSPHFSSQNRCTILCLGESTTYAGGNLSYPSQLERILNNNGFACKVVNAGVSGTNTSAILARLQDYLDKYKPDIVVTMMGANDGNLEILRIPVLSNFKFFKLISFLILQTHDQVVERILTIFSWGPDKNLRIGDYYTSIFDYHEAERFYKKFIQGYPDDPRGYNKLGFLYKMWSNNLVKSEEMFNQAIDKGISDPATFRALGRVYFIKEDYLNAQVMFERANNGEPENWVNYFDLGRVYRMLGKGKESQDCFTKAVLKAQSKGQVYSDIGEFYFLIGDIAEFIYACESAIKEEPSLFKPYYLLGRYYYKEKRLKKAEMIYRDYLNKNVGNELCFASLVRIYLDMGDLQLSLQYKDKLEKIRLGNPGSLTAINFQKIKQALDMRGVKFICVQYPLRSLDDLRSNFIDTSGIVFVDNEKNFNDAIGKDGYEYYFVDAWGGDSGHCTSAGNKLLAENIAKVIMENYFSVSKQE